MSKQVEFLFDVGSPTAYLAYTQLPAIANNADAEVLWTPILLGGLFKAVGNQSPAFFGSEGRLDEGGFATFCETVRRAISIK